MLLVMYSTILLILNSLGTEQLPRLQLDSVVAPLIGQGSILTFTHVIVQGMLWMAIHKINILINITLILYKIKTARYK